MEDKDQSKQILKSNLEKRALLEKTKHLKKNDVNILREIRRVCTLNAMKKIQRIKKSS